MMEEMEKDELLKKWLSDDITNAELYEFKQKSDYDLDSAIIENAKHFKASHFSKVKSFNEFKQVLDPLEKNNVKKLHFYKPLLRIAAVFLIGFGIYYSFFQSNLTSIKTLASQKTTFELPDASSVTLNSLSKVDYNTKKWSEKREILLEGEAFFKVAKGSEFDVKTSEGVVSVLGTQFTVKQRDNYFEVKCFEGIVGVKSSNKSLRLTKGKTFRILNGVVLLDSIDVDSPNWLKHNSNFKSVPLYEVINEFERQYNVKISTKNVDKNRLFTGGFVHNNMEQALISITVPFNILYKKENQNKITLYSSE